MQLELGWLGKGFVLAYFIRSQMAITENEISFRELAWPRGLMSSSGGLEELGCISEFQHLAPTSLPAFPSQDCYPIDNKLLGMRMFPRYGV